MKSSYRYTTTALYAYFVHSKDSLIQKFVTNLPFNSSNIRYTSVCYAQICTCSKWLVPLTQQHTDLLLKLVRLNIPGSLVHLVGATRSSVRFASPGFLLRELPSPFMQMTWQFTLRAGTSSLTTVGFRERSTVQRCGPLGGDSRSMSARLTETVHTPRFHPHGVNDYPLEPTRKVPKGDRLAGSQWRVSNKQIQDDLDVPPIRNEIKDSCCRA